MTAVEWLRWYEERDADDGMGCPACDGAPGYMHAHDCEIAALIGLVNVPGQVNRIAPPPEDKP